MRILMWLTIGFTAACVVGAYLLSGAWLFVAAVLLAIAAFFLFFQKSDRAKIIAVMLLGFCLGALWQWGYDQFYISHVKAYDGQTKPAVLTVSDYSYNTEYGIAADCEMILNGNTYKVRGYFSSVNALSPGDKITGVFRFRLTTADSPEGATHHQGEGIFLLAYGDEGSQITPAEKIPLKYYPAVLRRQITDILDKVFPEKTVAFARALLLGDSSLLSYEDDTAFKLSGIRHIIAVSGLHVSILCALIYGVTLHRYAIAPIIGIPVLLLFAAIAGFTPSVVRACIMQALIMLALQFWKEYDPPTALSFAVLVMLLINPITITSVSFQLSVGCSAGIFLFSKRIHDYVLRVLGKCDGKTLRAKLCRWFASSVSVSVSAAAITTPLSALYFGTVSVVSLLTNLLTLWVVSFVFYGIMLVCLLGVLWMPMAKAVAWCVSWAIQYIIGVAKLLSASPFSAVYTCSTYIVLWLIATYVLFGVFLLLRKKRPILFAGSVVLLLIIAIALSWIEPRTDHYRVTVMDVGQGQSILLQSDQKYYLIDCGGDDDENTADIVAGQLLSQGITSLDGVILTHYDNDHTGGLLPLLTRIWVDTFYVPEASTSSDFDMTLTSSQAHRVCVVRDLTEIIFGDSSISLYPGNASASDNESGLCILFQRENCDILITGDRNVSGEEALMNCVDLPELELLVVGHHGSKYSTGLALLAETKPLAAVISVGQDNRYDHPSQQVLERLRLFGCSIWRTDLDGTIIFRG